MSDAEWEEQKSPPTVYIWSCIGAHGARIVEAGTRAQMDARWDALRVAYPDAWMTETQVISRSRVVRGEKP